MREFAVAVRDVLLLSAEGVDHITERRERLVDVGGLLEALFVIDGA